MRKLLFSLLGVSCLLGIVFMFSTAQNNALRANIRFGFGNEFSLFTQWMIENERKYENEAELLMRFGVWYNSHHKIQYVNSQKLNYTFGHNQFSDLTDQEFMDMYLMNNVVDSQKEVEPSQAKDNAKQQNIEVPDKIDWAELGKLNEIQAQAHCGSCWAFAGVAATEAEYAIKYNEVVKISEQQIMDCTPNDCHGGQISIVYNYFKSHSPAKLSNYRYIARANTNSTTGEKICKIPEGSLSQIKVTSIKRLYPATNPKLLETISEHVAGALLNGHPIRHYESGIYDGPCDPLAINHAVTLVGFGVDEEGREFWRLRNSWGKSWGEQGYGRLTREQGEKGQCGVNQWVDYPELQ